MDIESAAKNPNPGFLSPALFLCVCVGRGDKAGQDSARGAVGRGVGSTFTHVTHCFNRLNFHQNIPIFHRAN